MVWKTVLMILVLAVAACDLPRGAALRREIVNAPRETTADGKMPDFAVEPVTRAKLAVYDTWPAIGNPQLTWIGRVDQPNNRIIAPGDSVSITIWNTEDNGLLTAGGQRTARMADMRVSSNGTVFLPYVGDVRIAGMSPESARRAIERQYVPASPSAQVQLEMKEGRMNSVSLLGGVGRPGTYPLPDRDFTVMGLIAESGGVSNALHNPQIRLQRGGKIYGTSVEQLLSNPRLDTTLQGGDKIFVEADKRYFLSLGAAGTEAVHPFTKDRITALDALSIIGGVSDARADPQGILILRRYPNQALRPDNTGPWRPETVFTIDLTSADGLFSAGQFQIRSGDLVYVTESPVTTAQTIFGLIGSSLGLARQVSVATN